MASLLLSALPKRIVTTGIAFRSPSVYTRSSLIRAFATERPAKRETPEKKDVKPEAPKKGKTNEENDETEEPVAEEVEEKEEEVQIFNKIEVDHDLIAKLKQEKIDKHLDIFKKKFEAPILSKLNAALQKAAEDRKKQAPKKNRQQKRANRDPENKVHPDWAVVQGPKLREAYNELVDDISLPALNEKDDNVITRQDLFENPRLIYDLATEEETEYDSKVNDARRMRNSEHNYLYEMYIRSTFFRDELKKTLQSVGLEPQIAPPNVIDLFKELVREWEQKGLLLVPKWADDVEDAFQIEDPVTGKPIMTNLKKEELKARKALKARELGFSLEDTLKIVKGELELPTTDLTLTSVPVGMSPTPSDQEEKVPLSRYPPKLAAILGAENASKANGTLQLNGATQANGSTHANGATQGSSTTTVNAANGAKVDGASGAVTATVEVQDSTQKKEYRTSSLATWEDAQQQATKAALEKRNRKLNRLAEKEKYQSTLPPVTPLRFKWGYSAEPQEQYENKVKMFVDISALELTDPALERLKGLVGNRLDKKGVLKLVSNKDRSRARNKYNCKLLLAKLLEEAYKADPNYIFEHRDPYNQIVTLKEFHKAQIQQLRIARESYLAEQKRVEELVVELAAISGETKAKKKKGANTGEDMYDEEGEEEEGGEEGEEGEEEGGVDMDYEDEMRMDDAVEEREPEEDPRHDLERATAELARFRAMTDEEWLKELGVEVPEDPVKPDKFVVFSVIDAPIYEAKDYKKLDFEKKAITQ